MDGGATANSCLLLVGSLPTCASLATALGMALILCTVFVAWRVLSGLMRLLRAKFGYPDPSEPSRSHSPQASVQDMAARLRHDSPGGWTAGETRWTLAHEHGWFNSPDYRAFFFSIVVILAAWGFGLRVSSLLCG